MDANSKTMWTALEGMTVAARYKLQDHLATGGMAAVFRAWDHRLNRPVAVKVLRQLNDAEPVANERFRREARAAAALLSPYIVEVYDFFEECGCYYLVMELVDGINLKQHIVQRCVLSPTEALPIVIQVCRALEVAHERDFIHRDIKPQNILLAPCGTVKLTDFGIVHIAHARSFTASGMVLGTADYISPEQAQGLALTPASDLYSLGVVLYEMLTGTLPFSGTTSAAVAMQHATAAVPLPRYANPAIPLEVERFVMRALRKEPERRYASASAMGASAARLLATLSSGSALGEGEDAPLALVAAQASLKVSPEIPPVGQPLEWRVLAERLSQLPHDVSTVEETADDDMDACDVPPDGAARALTSAAPLTAAEGTLSPVKRFIAVCGFATLLVIGLLILHLFT